MALENIVGKKSIENRKKYGQKYGLMSAISGYARNVLVGIGLASLPVMYGGCGEDGGGDFTEEEPAPERMDMGVPPDPCEDNPCQKNAYCAVNEKELAECICNSGYGLDKENGECVPNTDSRLVCPESPAQCISRNSLQVCVPTEQAECMLELDKDFRQPIEARCDTEYSECNTDEGYCRVSRPGSGYLDPCSPRTNTLYVHDADRFDIVEEGNNQRRRFQPGEEARSEFSIRGTCGENQGIFVGNGPENSYVSFGFDSTWCRGANTISEYTISAVLSFPTITSYEDGTPCDPDKDERACYRGDPGHIQINNEERYEFYPNKSPCQKQKITRLRYPGEPPVRITFEGPRNDGYFLITEVTLEENLCDEDVISR